MKQLFIFGLTAFFALKITLNAQCTGPLGQNAAEWVMTFQDEFDGTSLNAALWNNHIWYEDPDPVVNYAVQGGSLKIWPATGFVNRTIDTDGKFDQMFGFFEARMKLNIGLGCWPAFWLYGHPDNDRPEIDIMEAYPGGGPSSGWGDAQLHPVNYGMTLHKANEDYSWHEIPYSITHNSYQPELDLSAAFHVYGVKWDATTVSFYFDGQPIGPTYSYSDAYYHKELYILLDLWFGSASGVPNTTDTPMGTGNAFEIDYVRVWSPGVCSVVPVTWLTPLTARLDQERVLLSWAVSEQENHREFGVEHSTDGIHFRTIGHIDNGAVSNHSSYIYPHNTPAPGVNYYRLRQTDFDGRYQYSHIAQVWYDPSGMAVFPNPAQDVLFIKMEKTGEPIMVYDQYSRLKAIWEAHEGVNQFDLTDFPAGGYYLLLGRHTARCFVKIKAN